MSDTELEGGMSLDGFELQGSLDFSDGLDGDMDVGGISVVCNDDYEALRNRPSIEGVELIGDKSLPDFGEKPLSNIEIKTIFDRVFRKD